MTEQLLAEVDSDKQATYAEKIAKLLRKAETTDSAPEADALMAKAQELMRTYAITDELLAKAQGRQVQDEIASDVRVKYTGIYQSALFDIGWAIARANNCRGFINKVTWTKPTYTELQLIGFKSDCERVVMLDASLQIQCAQQLARWWRSEDRSWMSKMQAFKAKREFIMGFASGLSSKLHEANRLAAKAAATQEAERTNTTEAEASTSVELVLRSREEQVKDWYDKRYGKSTRSVSRRYSSGGAAARSAGYSAGRSSNTGTTGLGGGSKAIGR